MNFTQTDYYKAVSLMMPPSNKLEQDVQLKAYPSITLTEFSALDPNIPSRLHTSCLCIASIARTLYHLFYAIVVGLPADYLIFKTQIFLTNWEKMKFNIIDPYAHVLTVITPLNGAFLQQQQLFSFEWHQVKKNPEDLSDALPPRTPNSQPTHVPTPPPPPPLSNSSLNPRPVLAKKSPQAFGMPNPQTTLTSASLENAEELKGEDLRNSMHQKLGQIGIRGFARPKGGKLKPSIPPPTLPKPSLKKNSQTTNPDSSPKRQKVSWEDDQILNKEKITNEDPTLEPLLSEAPTIAPPPPPPLPHVVTPLPIFPLKAQPKNIRLLPLSEKTPASTKPFENTKDLKGADLREAMHQRLTATLA